MKNDLKSPIVKRAVLVAGDNTSISLEEPFWQAFKEIAQRRGLKVNELIVELDRDRDKGNLWSCIRLYVLHCFRD